MKTAVVLFSIATVLSGCSSAPPAPPSYWTKAGGDQQQFRQASAKCRMQTSMIPASRRDDLNMNTAGGNISAAGRDLQDMAAQQAFMDDCLVADGWTLQQAPPKAPDVICVRAEARINDPVKTAAGKQAVVRALHGASSRCQEARFPILASVDLI